MAMKVEHYYMWRHEEVLISTFLEQKTKKHYYFIFNKQYVKEVA